MSQSTNLVPCYNRTCGQNFDPQNNKEGDCIHHPGKPFFHDAYKGWSCCKKKCIDFTEFLNIKGCTKSFHSNEKPPEPVKPQPNQTIQVHCEPSTKMRLERPLYDSPMVTIEPTVASNLIEQINNLQISKSIEKESMTISIGQHCQNKSCTGTYKGPESNQETCKYHSGIPVFHEGMKYWSCCKKKTTDFSVFLQQPGCTKGEHVWISEKENEKIKCRIDWHQTATYVVISIYARKYNPGLSSVQLNPIRLTIDLFFPEDNLKYHHDTELRGIIDVSQSFVNMLSTKVEINLRKAEPGSWSELDFPLKKEEPTKEDNLKDEINMENDNVDLSGI